MEMLDSMAAELVKASQTRCTLRWTQSSSTLAFQQTLQRLTWNSRCLRAPQLDVSRRQFEHVEVGMDQTRWCFMIFAFFWVDEEPKLPAILTQVSCCEWGVARSCLEIVSPSPILRLCELHFLGDSWFLIPGRFQLRTAKVKESFKCQILDWTRPMVYGALRN